MNKNRYNAYMKYSGIGLQMFIIIILGILGGMKLNSYFGFEKPYITAISALFSVILSMIYAVRQVTKK